MELLRQSGESLAGRVSYIELPVLNLLEIQPRDMQEETLWVRGGFPESYLATDEEMSFSWRVDLLRTYLERDIPQFGSRIPAATLRRFWTMLAHAQGGLFKVISVETQLSRTWPRRSQFSEQGSVLAQLHSSRSTKPPGGSSRETVAEFRH